MNDAETIRCPECANGKHVNCTGWALEEVTDDVVTCKCTDLMHPWNQR